MLIKGLRKHTWLGGKADGSIWTSVSILTSTSELHSWSFVKTANMDAGGLLHDGTQEINCEG